MKDGHTDIEYLDIVFVPKCTWSRDRHGNKLRMRFNVSRFHNKSMQPFFAFLDLTYVMGTQKNGHIKMVL